MDNSVNQQTIRVRVMSTTAEYDCGEVITAGDYAAYTLEVEFMDVDAISGVCNLHFIRGNQTTQDVFAEIDGNIIRHMLDTALYEMPGLQCWVQFIDSNLLTPLEIIFSEIRLYTTGPAVTDLDPYPEWLGLILQLEAAIQQAIQTGLNVQAIADEINRAYLAGELIGPMGPMPVHQWNGYLIRFQLSDSTWGDWTDIRGATGKTAFEAAVEAGWTDTEATFNTHLAHVDHLFYDAVRASWIRAAVVTQAAYEDMITLETTDPNTMYFVLLPEEV